MGTTVINGRIGGKAAYPKLVTHVTIRSVVVLPTTVLEIFQRGQSHFRVFPLRLVHLYVFQLEHGIGGQLLDRVPVVWYHLPIFLRVEPLLLPPRSAHYLVVKILRQKK